MSSRVALTTLIWRPPDRPAHPRGRITPFQVHTPGRFLARSTHPRRTPPRPPRGAAHWLCCASARSITDVRTQGKPLHAEGERIAIEQYVLFLSNGRRTAKPRGDAGDRCARARRRLTACGEIGRASCRERVEI